MKFVEEQSQSDSIDKSLGTLTTIKFDGSCTIYEHVNETTNVAVELKSIGMELNKNFLVKFIINSLPS